MAAAAVVGAMGGGAVLGDDHMSGEHVDCSYVPWDCLDECLELKWCVAIPENDGIADCLSERLALAACEADPGGGSGGGSGGGVVIIPGCPGGQHYHASGGCHADHECGDDEIGGGSEECQACGDGEAPNEDGTACRVCPDGEHEGQCDAFHEVARCERALDIPLAEYLPIPTHPNVLVENLALANSEIQRGFFPVNEDLAVDFAKIYVATIGAPGGPIVVYVDSKVERDADQGICEYEGEVLYEGENPVVESPRHDTVKKRMLTTVHTRDPWHQYHALVRNSIKWADEVLR